jgi:hypothetical protein
MPGDTNYEEWSQKVAAAATMQSRVKRRLAVALAGTLSCSGSWAFGDGSTGVTTVPLTIQDDQPVIQAKIQGADVSLTFDLGDTSSTVALPQEVLARAGVSSVRDGPKQSDAMGNVTQSETFTLTDLQIGTIHFANVDGRTDAHDAAYQPTSAAGKLGHFGTSLFGAYAVVLDYPHHRFTLIDRKETSAYSAGCKGVPVDFIPRGEDGVITHAGTDFGQLVAVWDTDASVSILRRAGAPSLATTDGSTTVTTRHLILGGHDFGPLRLIVADYSDPPETDMFIGHNFFTKHIVCIDFPNSRLLIRD